MKLPGNLENAKVSVVIPAYNIEQYICKSIQSALSQTYKDLEVVVVNDGSTDRTWDEILRISAADDRVVAITQHNQGAAAARNKALKHCTGDFITFLDGDDMLHPETIELNLRLFSDNIDWIEFPVIRVDNAGNNVDSKEIGTDFKPQEFRLIERDGFVDLFLNKGLSGLVCGSIYRRAVIKDIHFPDGIYYEDSFFYLDVLTKSQCGAVSPHGSYYYLERQNSSQHIPIDEKRLRSKLKYDIKLIDTIKECSPNHTDYIKQLYPQLYYYYKLQYAKGVMGGKSCFEEIKQITGKQKLGKSRRMKLSIYRLLGYDNIMRFLRLIRRR